MTDKRAYSLAEAAAACGIEQKKLRRAIHSPGGEGNPIPLKAKTGIGRGYTILRKDLDAWLEAHPDA